MLISEGLLEILVFLKSQSTSSKIEESEMKPCNSRKLCCLLCELAPLFVNECWNYCIRILVFLMFLPVSCSELITVHLPIFHHISNNLLVGVWYLSLSCQSFNLQGWEINLFLWVALRATGKHFKKGRQCSATSITNKVFIFLRFILGEKAELFSAWMFLMLVEKRKFKVQNQSSIVALHLLFEVPLSAAVSFQS